MEFIDDGDELKNRFIKKRMENMLNGNVKPFPVTIIEEEDSKFIELLQPFVMFGKMTPFTKKMIRPPIEEYLYTKKIENCGELYCLIISN